MAALTRRAALALAASGLFARPGVRAGHHFYNWDRAWDRDLDIRLRYTIETGWEGFEAKPEELGVAPELLAAKCRALGLECAAVGGGPREAIDYAGAVGAAFARVLFPMEETKRWVEYAGAKRVSIVIHNHIGSSVETREDLLRALEDRPGTYACPDTGHLLLCGCDPVKTIRDLGPLCRYIHLKDIVPARVGSRVRGGDAFPDLGTGALDLAGVLRALESIGYAGWLMVERDSRSRDYVASARAMREQLRRLGY